MGTDKNNPEQLDISALEQSAYHELDTSGLICPEPVMLLHKLVRSIAAGDLIKMLATDSTTERDVARFCEFLRHPLIHAEKQGQHYIYWIKKRL